MGIHNNSEEIFPTVTHLPQGFARMYVPLHEPIEMSAGSGIYVSAMRWVVSGTGENTGGWGTSGSDVDTCQYTNCELR